MPRAAADTPRKMLPPPTTRQTSTPRLRTWATSAAICATMPGSMPYSRLPIRASPEIFTRTRLYLGGLYLGGAIGCASCRDLVCQFVEIKAVRVSLKQQYNSFHLT